jgi:hypothetical protein
MHTIGAEPNLRFGTLQLPTPEDPAAIQLSVARISDAIINNRLDQKKAASLLYALQIAAQFIDHKNIHLPANGVESAEQNSIGDELAPDVYICRVDDNCKKCPKFAQCTKRHQADKKKVDKKDDAGEQEDE